MERKIDFLSGNVFANVWRFSLPLIFTNLLQVLFNTADVAVAGRFAGPAALGAVGSTTMLIFMTTGFAIGIGVGVNAVASFFAGANRKAELFETVHTAFFLCFGVGMFLCVVALFAGRSILVLMGTKNVLLKNAVLYFRIYSLALPSLSIYNFGSGILNALGETKKPFLVLCVAGIVNIALNLFFVIVLRIDVVGVAISSVISQTLSAALILIFVFKKFGRAKIKFFKIKKAKKILSIALPTGIQSAIFAFANIFIQSAINTFDATTVAANTAASNSDPFVYDVMSAFYTACTTFTGQNLGAGNYERIKKTFRVTCIYSFCFGLFLGLSFYIFAKPFLAIFTTDEQVAKIALIRVKIMSLSYCVSALMDNTIAASRGLGKTIIPSLIVIAGSCVFRIVWIFTIFAHFKTLESLFLLFVFSWTITAIAEMIYYFKIRV